MRKKHPVLLAKVRTYGGWDNNQPAAFDANFRWQSGD